MLQFILKRDLRHGQSSEKISNVSAVKHLKLHMTEQLWKMHTSRTNPPALSYTFQNTHTDWELHGITNKLPINPFVFFNIPNDLWHNQPDTRTENIWTTAAIGAWRVRHRKKRLPIAFHVALSTTSVDFLIQLLLSSLIAFYMYFSWGKKPEKYKRY